MKLNSANFGRAKATPWESHVFQRPDLENFGKMFVCPICKEITRCKNSYIQHMDDTHASNASKRNYPCPKCVFCFHNRTSFYNHMNESHQKSEEVIKVEHTIFCRHCSKTFEALEDFESHFESFEEGTKIPCPFCRPAKNLATVNAYRVHKHR